MTTQEPIRIAQIMGKWVGGGVEAVVMNYYRNIDRSKVQFDFIFDEDSLYIPFEEIESMGGRVFLVPPYQKVVAYQSALTKILRDGHYLVTHSHVNTLSVFSLLAAKRAGVPVRIAHSHSTTNKNEAGKNLFKNMLKTFSKRYATDYMCCSEHAGRWQFGNKAYDAGEVYLLRNAIDLKQFDFNAATRACKREELGIGDSTLVVGNIGRMVKQKNQSFLLEVFKELHNDVPDSVLLIIGQGPLANELHQHANELGISSSVNFLGQRNDVSRLYQAMDLFCMPSLYEGFGMVAVEAQVAGLATVASTEVPKVAGITENMTFLDLGESPHTWAKELETQSHYARIGHSKEAKQAGLDIVTEAKKLERFYLDRTRQTR